MLAAQGIGLVRHAILYETRHTRSLSQSVFTKKESPLLITFP